MDPVNQVRDLLDVIGCLFKNGADPTIKCSKGLTPRAIADVHKFKIGSALLGKLMILRLTNFSRYLFVIKKS